MGSCMEDELSALPSERESAEAGVVVASARSGLSLEWIDEEGLVWSVALLKASP